MAKISVTVPDGPYCNDGLKCRYMVHAGFGDDHRVKCTIFGQGLSYAGPDSAYVEKCFSCGKKVVSDYAKKVEIAELLWGVKE